MAGELWLIWFAAAGVACQAPSAVPSDSASSTGARPRSPAVASALTLKTNAPVPGPIHSGTAQQGALAPAPVPQADPLPRYPAIAKPLPAPCRDPRVVLAVRTSGNPMGALWVQQALVANPELQLVVEQPTASAQVELYTTIYGVKSFAPSKPGFSRNNNAVIGRCADVDTCNSLAAMFQAVSPEDHVLAVCGVPPLTTGGFSHVPQLAPESLTVPAVGASRIALCARAHACLARVGAERRPLSSCEHIAQPKLESCAIQRECSDVATCIAGEIQ